MFYNVYSDRTTTAFVEPDPAAGTIARRPHNAVYGGQIETQFARIFRLEGTDLELENKVTVETDVVEEQVYVKGLPIDNQRNLTAHEREAAAQLQQKVPKVLEEPALQLPFLGA